MAAATQDLNILEKADPRAMVHERLAGGTASYFKGAMIAMNFGAAGSPFIRATAGNAALRVIGRCEESKTLSGANPGNVYLKVKSGIFRYTNGGATPATTADVGKVCYVVDDQTVGLNGTTTSTIAGRIYALDGAGGTANVWVVFDPFSAGSINGVTAGG